MFDMTDHAVPIQSFPASSFKMMTLMPSRLEIKPIYVQEHGATQSSRSSTHSQGQR